MSRLNTFRSPTLAAVLALSIALPSGAGLGAQAKPATSTPPPGTNADTGWPRSAKLPSGLAELYQPQVASWEGQKHMVAWAAVSYTPNGAKEPALGTVKLETETQVSVDDRVVGFDAFKVTQYNFPSLSPAQSKTLASEVAQLPPHERVIDLDRVLAYARKSPLNVKNLDGIKADPPKVFSSLTPAILIGLDGPPVWSAVKGLDLQYAVNTNWDLFEHTPSKMLYVRSEGSWLEAPAVGGPWKPVSQLPPSFAKLPADDNWKDVKAAVPGKKLTAKTMPTVFTSTEPAELIQLTGAPSYLVVEGAPSLLWVSNTESDLFRMGKTGDFYYLVAGRWFTAADLAGPWTFATPTLPAEFKNIPVEHPRSRVLASIPGHGRGDRSRVARADSPHRAGEQERVEGAGRRDSRRTATEGDRRRDRRAASRQHRQGHPEGGRPLLHVLPGGVVHVEGGDRAVGSGLVGAERDLHHPGQLAGESRHLCDRGRRR